MGGFLDASYGVAEERRGKVVRRMVVLGMAAVLAGTGLYFSFRNYRQEQIIKQFFSLLEQKKYQEAYSMMGCTQEHPCKYYDPQRFMEDFGPQSRYANVSAIKIEHEDTCGNGVVFDVGQTSEGLFVDKETNTVSFFNEPRCPGKHLQIWEFLKSRFG